MELNPQLFATAGWTSFAAVFSTVFPLLVVLAVLSWYWVSAKRHP